MSAPVTPTVGLALIARDEEATLPRLLASVGEAFDEVALVDTGSTDGTVAAFEAWAAATPGVRTRVGHFTWIDDFAAARARADGFLTTDWRAWADCDDVLRGADALRRLAAGAPPDVGAFLCAYDYAGTGAGEHVLLRERLVRSGAGTWRGRIHEVQDVRGRLVPVPAAEVLWIHHDDGGADRHLAGTSRQERDLAILEEEVAADPHDARAWFYLAQTQRDLGRFEAARDAFDRRAALGGWEEEAFWARFQAASLRARLGDWPTAFAGLVSAWESRPGRLEPLHELCWRLRLRGEHHAALAFVRAGLGAPSSSWRGGSGPGGWSSSSPSTRGGRGRSTSRSRPATACWPARTSRSSTACRRSPTARSACSASAAGSVAPCPRSTAARRFAPCSC